uniref:FGF n=1 Tax=Sparus aurata TaxID=8175 RepID=A0A671TSF6_SPAAU
MCFYCRFKSSSNQRRSQTAAALLPRRDRLPSPDSVQRLRGRRWLKMFAMKHGVVGIRGVKSGLYLCMSAQGRAYGAVSRSEHLEENHYTTYSSLAHPGLYLALSHRGELRKGNTVGRHQSCTHFLPRRTTT